MRPSLVSAVALSIVALYALPATAQDDQDTAEVQFDDQSLDGDMVIVANVTLPEGGFVTIHDDTLLDGDALGSVLGTSDYLEAGSHSDVEVMVDMMNADDEEMTLIAMPHMDTNDNEEYDFVTSDGADDGPYTDGGEAVTDDAQITKEDDDLGDDDDMGDDQDDDLGDDQDDDLGDGLDDPGDDIGDGQDDDVVDGDEDAPGLQIVAVLALLGAVAVLARRK